MWKQRSLWCTQECHRCPGMRREMRREAGNRFCLVTRKEPALLTPWPWTSSLQSCETIRFYCQNHSICATLNSSLRKLTTASLESFLPLVQVGSKGATSDVGSSSPQTFKSPAATLVFPAEATDCRHQTVETCRCYCVLIEFLTHRIRECNKQPLF